jgi:probable rRNA maturation factor
MTSLVRFRTGRVIGLGSYCGRSYCYYYYCGCCCLAGMALFMLRHQGCCQAWKTSFVYQYSLPGVVRGRHYGRCCSTIMWDTTTTGRVSRRFSGSCAAVVSLRSIRIPKSTPMWLYPDHRHQRQRPPLSRLLGSKLDSGIPGKVLIANDQTTNLTLDLNRLRTTVAAIRNCIGYDSYDVALFLVNDDEMRTTNKESRSVDAPTDILSFPFHEAVRPGLLQPPAFDIPDYYNLGDMLIDVPYVMRACRDDQDNVQESYQGAEADGGERDGDEMDDDERGVSGAMASVFDPEQRVHMLLVHGMLHLVGYDHENDDDYEQMVSKEEEIMRALKMIE